MSSYATSVSPPISVAVTPGPPPPSSGNYVYVLVAMENQDYGSVIGNPNAPSINSLVSQGATLTNYHSLADFSEPNYVAMVAGTTTGVSSDQTRNLGTCNTPVLPALLDAARIPWIVLQENPSVPGWRGGAHNGFMDMIAIATQAGSGCSGYVASNCPNSPAWRAKINCSAPDLPTAVLQAVRSGNQYIWVTPADSHNMHDVPVSTGDQWLRSWIPQLLALPPFQPGGKGILHLWWDENSNPPNVWYGPPIKRGYVSPNNYDHYSTLRLQELLLGLGDLGANDASANPMTEILVGS